MTLHYGILVKAARIVGAAVVSRGAHNVLQGRRFLTEHRMLVTHTLKRSAGIGAVGHHRGGGSTTPPAGGNGSNGTRSREQLQLQAELEEDIEELAEAFMVLITATEFLEVSCFLLVVRSALFALLSERGKGLIRYDNTVRRPAASAAGAETRRSDAVPLI